MPFVEGHNVRNDALRLIARLAHMPANTTWIEDVNLSPPRIRQPGTSFLSRFARRWRGGLRPPRRLSILAISPIAMRL
jgi:hypothetical protein